MSRPQDADRNQDATCYVGNIDERASDALIWELMLQAGPVVNVHLPKDRITSSHQGYGFCEFQTEVDAEYACKIMNGIKLFGKPLRVNKASSDRKQVDIGANLFVGNLDGGVDERMLFETFSAFGTVVDVPKVARDEQTAVSRNFGFVSFDSFESSDAAIEALNNQYLLNRPINVSYALKKDGKGGERHGTPAERLLAAQARKNNALPQTSRLFPPPPPPPSGFPTNIPTSGQPPPPPPPPSHGMPIAAGGGPNGHAMQPPPQPMPPPPPPPGFAAAYGGAPPPGPPLPPPPNGVPTMYYGPPPNSQGGGGYPGPPPQFMTGANNAPLGPRHG